MKPTDRDSDFAWTYPYQSPEEHIRYMRDFKRSQGQSATMSERAALSLLSELNHARQLLGRAHQGVQQLAEGQGMTPVVREWLLDAEAFTQGKGSR
jgi:hypothetical protein